MPDVEVASRQTGTAPVVCVADWRSPIARGWGQAVADIGITVHVLSSAPVPNEPGPARSVDAVPLALGSMAARLGQRAPRSASRSRLSHAVLRLSGTALSEGLRDWIPLAGLQAASKRLSRALETYPSATVHALRLPFEGLVAARAAAHRPVVLSIWGNDFTIFTTRTRMHQRVVRQSLALVDVLVADCHADVARARMLGYQGPAFVIPGNGGVDIGTFHPGAKVVPDFLDIEDDRAVLLNPRGIRRYIRNHQWFAALAELKSRGTAFYAVCPGMLGHPMAERLVNRYGLKDQVILLPHMAPNEMAALYRLADVSVSLSDHDGTPNTLLEAMGCGTFPVVSVLPSYREWLSDGETCLEVRGRTPGEAADVIGRAIESSGLRRAAVDRLSAQVRDRASRNAMAASIADVYNEASRIRR